MSVLNWPENASVIVTKISDLSREIHGMRKGKFLGIKLALAESPV
jgi:hypothetical protein